MTVSCFMSFSRQFNSQLSCRRTPIPGTG
jgi:hypothetical protein